MAAHNGKDESLSIVIPTYNDLASLRRLIDRLAQQPGLQGHAVLVVDDGSFPPIAAAIGDLGTGLHLEVVTLKRNVGHQRAIAAGLAHEVAMQRADIIAIIGGDGEDRPEDVPRLVAAVQDGGADVSISATKPPSCLG
jgi:glycosyltransferase involved in cell wall biosynthesis